MLCIVQTLCQTHGCTKAILSQLQQAIKYKVLRKELEPSKLNEKEENTIALNFNVAEKNKQADLAHLNSSTYHNLSESNETGLVLVIL